jgi:hypothetical protein
MSAMELAGVPVELRSDLDTKFNRYSTDSGGVRQLNFSGLKYMLKSVPGSPLEALPESRLEELFLDVAGAGATKRSSKLAFDAFARLLRALARDVYGDTESAPLCLVLQCLLPHRLAEERFKALLDSLTADGVAAAVPVAAAAPGAGAPEAAPAPPATEASPPPAVAAPPPPQQPQQQQSMVGGGGGTRLDGRGIRVPANFEFASQAVSPRAREGAGAGADAQPPSSLAAFLAPLRLDTFIPSLEALGVRAVADLVECTDGDLEALGLRELQRRRLRDALARHGALAAAAPGEPQQPRQEPAPKPERGSDAASAAAGVWDEHVTADGYLYYHNDATQETVWERPQGAGVQVRTRESRALELLSSVAHEVEEGAGVGGGENSGGEEAPHSDGRPPAAAGPRLRSPLSPARGGSVAHTAGPWGALYGPGGGGGGRGGGGSVAGGSARSGDGLGGLPSARAAAEIARARAAADARARLGAPTEWDPTFSRRGPLVDAPTQLVVSSTVRSVVEARNGGSGWVEGEFRDSGAAPLPLTAAGRSATGYLHGGNRSYIGAGHTLQLSAAAHLSPRPTSLEEYTKAVAQAPAAEVYREVFEELPVRAGMCAPPPPLLELVLPPVAHLTLQSPLPNPTPPAHTRARLAAAASSRLCTRPPRRCLRVATRLRTRA